jgi:hypothetical protein
MVSPLLEEFFIHDSVVKNIRQKIIFFFISLIITELSVQM